MIPALCLCLDCEPDGSLVPAVRELTERGCCGTCGGHSVIARKRPEVWKWLQKGEQPREATA